MARRSSKLIVLAILASGAALLALLPFDMGLLRVALVLPFVLVLPGYAITAAAFPRRALGLAEVMVLSIGLSLSVTALGGFLLHWSDWGLQPRSWTVLLWLVTLVAIVVALIRIRRESRGVSVPVAILITWREGLVFGLAALVVVAAVGLARLPTPQDGLQGYSQLWILPADTADQHTLRIGLNSQEFASTSYRLQLEVDSRIIKEWTSITLGPGETWESLATVPPEQLGAESVEALLYRLDTPTQVYRRVIWRPASS